MNNELKYYPEFFNPKSLEDAKDIILGVHEWDLEERWKEETNWMRDLFRGFRNFDENSVVLDFGTGIGRVAKMIIEEFGCTVYGCDISKGMLDYSVDYVNSDKYHSITFEELPEYKNFFTNITAIWVLQHIPNSAEVIHDLTKVSKSRGFMFVTDLRFKSVPCIKNDNLIWGVDHETSNKQILEQYYNMLSMGTLPESVYKGNPDNVINNSWWGNLQLGK